MNHPHIPATGLRLAYERGSKAEGVGVIILSRLEVLQAESGAREVAFCCAMRQGAP
jgi:hypothetical protein